MSEPNTAIPLYCGPITIQDDRGSATGNGVIELQWVPGIEVRFDIPDLPPVPVGKLGMGLAIPGAIGTGPILMTRATRGLLRGPLQLGQNVLLSTVRVSLVNFFHLLPPWSIAPVVWDVDGWQITFNAVPDAARLTKEVEATGGYAITHAVRIERQDSAGFSIDDFKALSEVLRRFLSFVQGRWIALVLPVGYDSGEQAVWREWGPWRMDSWGNYDSWADPQEGSHLGEAFSGFLRRRQDAFWKETLDSVIYWYVESNHNPLSLETSIILAQVALERLAWHYLAIQSGMSKRKCDDLHAEGRIKKTLVDHRVPIDIPAQFREMTSHGCKDVVEGLIKVRNDLAHPTALMGADGRLLIETREASLWLLEILLLRLFDYSGLCADRRNPARWAGTVSPMPP
ncbi:MAG: hypothetical protein ABSG53_27230 [Thermoguttaceae bacterium]